MYAEEEIAIVLGNVAKEPRRGEQLEPPPL